MNGARLARRWGIDTHLTRFSRIVYEESVYPL
jgi:hypothetical protein